MKMRKHAPPNTPSLHHSIPAPMNILDTIVAQKRIEAARLPAGPVTASSLQAALEKRGYC